MSALLFFLLLACSTEPEKQSLTDDPRSRCISGFVEACYEAGLLEGQTLPDKFGKRVTLSADDVERYLGRACDKDYKDSCSLMPPLIQRGADAEEVLLSLFYSCSKNRVRNACNGILQVQKDDPDLVSSKMEAHVKKVLSEEL